MKVNKVTVRLLHKTRGFGKKYAYYSYVYECSCGKVCTRSSMLRHLIKHHKIPPEEAKKMLKVRKNEKIEKFLRAAAKQGEWRDYFEYIRHELKKPLIKCPFEFQFDLMTEFSTKIGRKLSRKEVEALRSEISEILEDREVKYIPSFEIGCGDEEAIHFYSPKYDVVIHVCLSDPENVIAIIDDTHNLHKCL